MWAQGYTVCKLQIDQLGRRKAMLEHFVLQEGGVFAAKLTFVGDARPFLTGSSNDIAIANRLSAIPVQDEIRPPSVSSE